MVEMEAAGQVPAPAEQRPLWRRIANFPLVALLIALGIFVATNALLTSAFYLLPKMDKVAEMAVKAAIGIPVFIAVYKTAISRLGERHHDDLPFTRTGLVQLGTGLFFGFLLFSLIVGIAAVANIYNIVGDGDFSTFVPVLISLTIVPAFAEELVFRGILFRWIEEFAGSWVALALTSALFGFAHFYNPNASLLSSFAIAVEAGILLGGLYMLTRSLWAPMGLHAAWNFTQGFIYDVPISGLDQDGIVEAQLSGPELLSGGAFGLEASLIAMVLATAAGVVLVVLAIRKGELVRPWWVRRRLARIAA